MIGQKQNQSGNGMTPKEVEEYGKRVEAMAKKEPAYHGWGFFYFRRVSNKGEYYGRKESTRNSVEQVLTDFQR